MVSVILQIAGALIIVSSCLFFFSSQKELSEISSSIQIAILITMIIEGCVLFALGKILELVTKIHDSDDATEFLDTVCAHCNSEIELSVSDIQNKMYTCPDCNKVNSVTKITSII